MSIFGQDDFTNSDGTDLASHTPDVGTSWVEHGSLTTGSLDIQSNRVRCGSLNPSVYYISADPGGGSPQDHDVQCHIECLTDINAIGGGPAGRIATGANTMYWTRKRQNNSHSLIKVDAGTSSTLVNVTGQTDTEDGAMMLRIRDSEKGIWWLGSQQGIDTTDNAITAAGKAGIRDGGSFSGTTTGVHYDDFVATDLAVAGAGSLLFPPNPMAHLILR